MPLIPRAFWLMAPLLAGVLTALTGPLPPPEQPPLRTWNIAPGQEREVVQWLGPLTDGAQLPGNVHISGVQIAQNHLQLELAGENSPIGLVTLTPVGQPLELQTALPPNLPPDLANFIRNGARHLPLPGPFALSQPQLRPPPLVPWTILAAGYATLRFFSLLTLLFSALWFWRTQPKQRLPYALLTILAALLRWKLSPPTFLHELYHVDESLSSLAGQPGFFNGYAGPALYSALVPWLHMNPAPIFAIHLVASTLCVPLLGRLAAHVWQNPQAGYVAALLLAFSPLHLRWGMAEDQWILGTFWALLALTLWLEALQTDYLLPLLLALLATSLGLQTRPELLPLPLLLLLLARGQVRVWVRRPRVWLCLLLATLATWPLLLLLLHRPDPPPATLEHLLALPHLSQWLDPTWTPLPLLWFSVLALVLALVSRRVDVLLLTLAALVWTGIPLLFFGSPGPFLQRTQLFPTALLLVLAAGALPNLLNTLPLRLWLAGLVFLLSLALHDRLQPVTQLFAQQREWEFLHANVMKLPLTQQLLAPAGNFPDRFPIALFAQHPPPELVNQDLALAQNRWPEPGQKTLYYQSMACFIADQYGRPPPAGQHPRCQAVQDRYVLEPVLTTTLDAPGDLPLWHSLPGHFPVGFWRLKAWK